MTFTQSKTSPKRHLLISGTGRAGTSFLVSLLTRLGRETGFTSENLILDPRFRAGLEVDIWNPDAPYVIKSPLYCAGLASVLDEGLVLIDHAIIPVRDFEAAAHSRWKAQQAAGGVDKPALGGLWLTKKPEEQKAILYEQFGNLIVLLARHNVPFTFLSYPQFMKETEYLFMKLRHFVPGKSYDDFLMAFNATVRPEWINAI